MGLANDQRLTTNDAVRGNDRIRSHFLSTPTTTQPSTASDWELHSHQDKELVQVLGLTSSTMLVIGSMIGSGIFIVSSEIGREVGSPALLIGAWVVTGIMTIVAALSYGELAAMMPRAGGQYVYLREALGPLWGFLYGWTLFLVIQTGTIAAVAVAFGKFLGVFYPSISSTHWIVHLWKVPPIPVGPMVLGNMDVGINTQNLVAILLVILLSLVNILGVKTGAAIQNIFTAAKVLALFGLAALGFAFCRNPEALLANFHGHFWENAGFSAQHAVQVGVGGPIVMVGTLTILAVAQVGSLFSADAWNNVTFTAGEVKNPSRNLPLSLALGTGVVIALYIACNFIYLAALPLQGTEGAATILGRGITHASEDRVATAVMTLRFGSAGGYLMAAAIMISSFGCMNGLILSGARVYYAMAKDGLFFRNVANLHPTYKTPAISLMVQMVWTCVLCISGSYSQLLDYIIFAVLVFYILTIVGLFVLRRTHPNVVRPYKAVGYPVLPIIYIVMALFIDVVLLRYKPQYTWPGLIVVLLGIPVYFAWSRSAARNLRATSG
jgi:basic amino acid/polyamine antiporter, APA family